MIKRPNAALFLVAIALLLPRDHAHADATMRTTAMVAPTIAEIFIETNAVRVELEIGSTDLEGFHNLLPDELLERKETAQQVRQAMAALPVRERTVLEFKYLQDLTACEIASHMKITEKAVHSLLYRARIPLRDRLKTMEPLFKEGPKL